jgi:putative cell wall-binding protein
MAKKIAKKAAKAPMKAKKKAPKVAKKVVKKAKKATKPAKKVVKSEKKPQVKVQKAPKTPKREAYESTGIYEETTIICPGCGRTTRVIKISGLDTEGMLCQRCLKGDIELEEMDF